MLMVLFLTLQSMTRFKNKRIRRKNRRIRRKNKELEEMMILNDKYNNLDDKNGRI